MLLSQHQKVRALHPELRQRYRSAFLPEEWQSVARELVNAHNARHNAV